MATGTPRAQLLTYLQSISGTHRLIGQTSHADNSEFTADTQAFGFSPAIMFNDPWESQWAGNAPFDASFMPAALAHAKAGASSGCRCCCPTLLTAVPQRADRRSIRSNCSRRARRSTTRSTGNWIRQQACSSSSRMPAMRC